MALFHNGIAMSTEWHQTTLGRISTDIAYGYTASASTKAVGPKFLRITDIQGDFIDWEKVPHCQIDEKKHKTYQLDVGDVVVARTGNSTGATAVIKKTVNAVFASYLIRYKLDTRKAEFRFVDFVLRSPAWSAFVKSNLGGSAQSGANAKVFAGFPLLLPPLPEQKAIAAVLSSLDDKIELLRNQNMTLERVAHAIFKEWFVEFNFPDKNGKPYKARGGKMVDSELGPIPEGWKAGLLSQEFKIIMGQSPPGSSYNTVGVGMKFFQGVTEFGFRFPGVRLYTTEPKKVAERFDVLVSVRAPVGQINVVPDRLCIGRGLAAVRSDHQSYALYKIMSLQERIARFESEGTVFGAITKDGMENLQVVVPDVAAVQAADEALGTVDAKIFRNHQEAITLVGIRDALLPKLISGQLRVE